MSQSELTRADICARYEQLPTSAVTDVMDRMGLHRRFLGTDFVPLNPGKTIAGFAFPVRGRAVPDPNHDCRLQINEFLRVAPENSIIVVGAGPERSCAHWGEFMSLVCLKAGCRGAVVAGGLRNGDHIAPTGFQVFYTFRSPLGAPGRWRVTGWDLAVEVGGVVIQPGDLIIGDNSGVVSIPEELIEQVLIEAEKVAALQREMRSDFQSGGDLHELIDKYGNN